MWEGGGPWGLPVIVTDCMVFPAVCEALPAVSIALGPILGFPSSVLQQYELKQVCLGVFLLPWSR